MTNKNERLFHQVLFLLTIAAIEAIAKRLNIGIETTRIRIHELKDDSSMKLAPCIYILCGDVSLKLWNTSHLRIMPSMLFREQLSEILYADAYNDLLKFILSNNVEELIIARHAEAQLISEEKETCLPFMNRTTEERKKVIETIKKIWKDEKSNTVLVP